jgi:hypothetical protein
MHMGVHQRFGVLTVSRLILHQMGTEGTYLFANFPMSIADKVALCRAGFNEEIEYIPCFPVCSGTDGHQSLNIPELATARHRSLQGTKVSARSPAHDSGFWCS